MRAYILNLEDEYEIGVRYKTSKPMMRIYESLDDIKIEPNASIFEVEVFGIVIKKDKVTRSSVTSDALYTDELLTVSVYKTKNKNKEVN